MNLCGSVYVQISTFCFYSPYDFTIQKTHIYRTIEIDKFGNQT
jgi:phage-related protein